MKGESSDNRIQSLFGTRQCVDRVGGPATTGIGWQLAPICTWAVDYVCLVVMMVLFEVLVGLLFGQAGDDALRKIPDLCSV